MVRASQQVGMRWVPKMGKLGENLSSTEIVMFILHSVQPGTRCSLLSSKMLGVGGEGPGGENLSGGQEILWPLSQFCRRMEQPGDPNCFPIQVRDKTSQESAQPRRKDLLTEKTKVPQNCLALYSEVTNDPRRLPSSQ
jgi:hypothetical protein